MNPIAMRATKYRSRVKGNVMEMVRLNEPLPRLLEL